MQSNRVKKIERKFLEDELSDYRLYDGTAKHESNRELRKLVLKLRNTELKHARFWAALLGIKDIRNIKMPLNLRIKVFLYAIVRKVLGIAFVTKMLERNEKAGLEDYKNLVKSEGFSKPVLERIKYIVREEEGHERVLMQQTQKHEAVLSYTKSIVFGLNDGLVEILAVVAGLAMVATNAFTVALTGIIVGVSGTLSMAAGAYVSSKSERVVEKSLYDKENLKTRPSKEAYYTGIFYFIGALVATSPFILGAYSYLGIVESVILVAVVLSAASALVAIISDTRIMDRIMEMLAVSLGTALVTAIIGFVVRTVFGIAISA